MAETKRKGDLGEAMVMADLLKRGYKIALPLGEDWRFDLIVERQGKLERVQCKYTESEGGKITARTQSCNNWNVHQYTEDEIDWLAIYDKVTEKCYYIPGSELGTGKASIYLRLDEPKNKQVQGIRWAKDYLII